MTISFKLHGETELPQSVIDAVPQSGAADSAISELMRLHSIDVSLSDSIKYLRSYGAWDDSELQDLEANKARILWLAALDCKEQGTTFFYMGE